MKIHNHLLCLRVNHTDKHTCTVCVWWASRDVARDQGSYTANHKCMCNPSYSSVNSYFFIVFILPLVPSCETEHTIITFKVDEKPLYWPEAQIGQTVFANCTCNNVTIAQASRFCGGDIATGATWENPDVSACNFTKTVGEICQLNVSAL